MANLYQKLQAYQKEDIYPFHMPGHKRQPGFFAIPSCDITEITGFDHLHGAEGILKEEQEFCAELFGAERSFFLVNGSTSGIEAAILSVVQEGEAIILARNCHQSAYFGAMLAGADISYVLPERAENFCGGVTPWAVAAAVKENPKAKAVVLVSPTYEGIVSDIAAISQIVHQAGMLLVVDEAHGAHLPFSPNLPDSALHLGADIVIQSVHKTLPAATQCALLHVQGKQALWEKVERAVRYVLTSSPSYLLLGNMSYLCHLLKREGAGLFQQYEERLFSLRRAFQSLLTFSLLGKEAIGSSGIFAIDEGKLVFWMPKKELSGATFGRLLRENYQIELEYAGIGHAIAMTSIADTPEGFSRLEQAVLEIDRQLQQKKGGRTMQEKFIEEKRQIVHKETEPALLPRTVLPYRKARGYAQALIPLTEAIGRICGEFIIPYPPGIPLLTPGEEIDREIACYLQKNLAAGIPVLGINSDRKMHRIPVLKI